MIPFNVLFEENNSDQIEYKGKLINKCYKINKPGSYGINFKFIQSNSKHKQAIAVYFLDFIGQCYESGDEVKLPKTRFPHLVFWEDTAPKEIHMKINIEKGCVLICNGSDLLGNKQICRAMYAGCAVFIEELDHNKFRFHCNDHEIDDDFDDLIFDVEIKKDNTHNPGKTGKI